MPIFPSFQQAILVYLFSPFIQTLANPGSKGCPIAPGTRFNFCTSLQSKNSGMSVLSPVLHITSQPLSPPAPLLLPQTPIVNRLVGLGPPVAACHTQVSWSPPL